MLLIPVLLLKRLDFKPFLDAIHQANKKYQARYGEDGQKANPIEINKPSCSVCLPALT